MCVSHTKKSLSLNSFVIPKIIPETFPIIKKEQVNYNIICDTLNFFDNVHIDSST